MPKEEAPQLAELGGAEPIPRPDPRQISVEHRHLPEADPPAGEEGIAGGREERDVGGGLGEGEGVAGKGREFPR